MSSSNGSGFDTHVPLRMPHSPGVNSPARGKTISTRKRRTGYLTRLINAGPSGYAESGYYSIPCLWLCPGRRIPLKIYRMDAKGKVKIMHECNRVYAPDEKAAQGPSEGRQWVFIDKRSASELLYYLNDNLDEILSSPYLSSSEKAEFFYYMAFRRIKNAFRMPARISVADMKQIIAIMIEQIFKDPEALGEVFSLMQQNVCRAPSHPMVTFGHSLNVGILATWFVMKVLGGLKRDTLEEVSLGYFFHNIGMMRIPGKVLNKEGSLSDGPWSCLRQHPQWGYEIMTKIRGMTPEMAHIVLEHHERPDGSGYPRSLSGTDIHFFVKVCAIMDTLDALISPRVYRQPMTLLDALKFMKERTPREYDPAIFSKLILVMLDADLI